MTKHLIKLQGEGFDRASASSAVLRDLLNVLVEGIRRVIRLQVEGQSTAPSLDPDWLVKSADFELLGFREGSTVVECETQPLVQASPEEFAQRDFFFSPIDVRESGLDLLEASLNAIQEGDRDSEFFDDKVLETVMDFRKVFRHGVDSVSFQNGDGVTVHEEDVKVFREMKSRIPDPSELRVAGLLDSVKVSAEAFELELDDGTRIRGQFDQDEHFEEFRDLLNESVVISGPATFKPSGNIRRLEARTIRPATSSDRVWAEAPTAMKGELKQREIAREQQSKRGLQALVGEWPGDESDEEIRRALEELS